MKFRFFHLLSSGLLLSGLVAYTVRPAGPPQLGQAPLRDILAALTPDEKVQLVVGVLVANGRIRTLSPSSKRVALKHL
ncbi:MAG: hypothetical protein ACRYG7_15645 [Janthinobacterium lividum]